jgi:hypothetical protein
MIDQFGIVAEALVGHRAIIREQAATPWLVGPGATAA